MSLTWVVDHTIGSDASMCRRGSDFSVFVSLRALAQEPDRHRRWE
jgi:hypothetical protein